MLRPLLLTLSASCLPAAVFAAEATPAVSPTAKVVTLFDGKTLAGWKGDAKWWRVENGLLTGGSLKETVPHNTFAFSDIEASDFVLRVRIKLSGAGGFINSGVQIRSQPHPKKDEAIGYQCDYGDPSWWGGIYDEGRRNRTLASADMAVLGPALKRDDFNDFVIRAQGGRITTWINGVMGVDYTETDASIVQRGRFAIQAHGGGKCLVQVESITLEELAPASPGSVFVGAAAPTPAAGPSPLAPEAQRASFSVPPGFAVELVTSEEQGVVKPIGVTWDHSGRLWTMTAEEYPVDANENKAAAEKLFASKGRDRVLVIDKPDGPGPHQTRVFADGLAIPLGILPMKDGVYVQHGTNLELHRDTDGDGKADTKTNILSGFGIQDSHLFPHGFTRGPGGWIYLAQGAFNNGEVKAGDGSVTKFQFCKMGRFTPDGNRFEVVQAGLNNIWGFVIGRTGEMWIQEANDMGYPAAPLHFGASYPGIGNQRIKPYAPIEPKTTNFPMGGTGLSGLALKEDRGDWPKAYEGVMFVANPITRKIQALRIAPSGPRFQLSLLPDFMLTADEWFRPIAIHFGPDGCLYIVDWYNKIISHNEVPRTHPERDKTRGRIWRVKYVGNEAVAKLPATPDLAKASPDELLAALSSPSKVVQRHAAEQIGDRSAKDLAPRLRELAAKKSELPDVRVHALWSLENIAAADLATLRSVLADPDRNLRREAVRILGNAGVSEAELLAALALLADDPDPQVRQALIRTLGGLKTPSPAALSALLAQVRAPLPTTGKPGPEHERAFERYLVRAQLETHAAATASLVASPAASGLSAEARLLAAQVLEPRARASALAGALATLGRSPEAEELVPLAEFADDPAVASALAEALRSPGSRVAVVEGLLAVRDRFDSAKLSALLTPAARDFLGGDAPSVRLGLNLAQSFRLSAVSPEILKLALGQDAQIAAAALAALGETGLSDPAPVLSLLASTRDEKIRDGALLSLASTPVPEVAAKVLASLSAASPSCRLGALDRLTSHKVGALAVATAVNQGSLSPDNISPTLLERLPAQLGAKDPVWLAAQEKLARLFRTVLRLDGTESAWTAFGSKLALPGPFTVETWIRFGPGISNADSILSQPDVMDLNFYDGRFRAWGPAVGDVVAADTPVNPEIWTHLAAVRDAQGLISLYVDGKPAGRSTKPFPSVLSEPRLGWSNGNGGTLADVANYRLWNTARTAAQIAADMDRALDPAAPKPAGLIFASGDKPWGKFQKGASLVRTPDFPPVHTPAEAAALDAKFEKFAKLAAKGDPARGKPVAALCQSCHQIEGAGGKIGPGLAGLGASGIEALLRNVITPNAAMESGYRIYRVELKDGSLLDGFFVSETKEAVVVRLPGSEDRRLPRAEIKSAKFLRRSLMPEGLIDGLPDQTAGDLLAYLLSVK